jgi:hypothetical protein
MKKDRNSSREFQQLINPMKRKKMMKYVIKHKIEFIVLFNQDDVASRRHVQSPVRPRIESKIGFTPQPNIPATPTAPATINSSDNEQNNRNDHSNYDSLVGSLKSDTLNWKDQQLTVEMN